MTANTGTTHLRQKARAPNAPLFWVRLVALSHAGVLTDALSHLPDPQRFLRWSVENFYPDYHWQGLIDRREAPRWNPDWIDPDQLHAEIVGRVNNAMQLMPRDMWPAAWASIMGDAITRLEKDVLSRRHLRGRSTISSKRRRLYHPCPRFLPPRRSLSRHHISATPGALCPHQPCAAIRAHCYGCPAHPRSADG
jgi:hypothetical protein